jgi:hypothetical protein
MGEPHRGHEIVKALGAGEVFGASRGLAHFYSLCGDLDAAADWSVKAIEERDPSILVFLQTKSGETLRASPRWPELAALMKLPAAEKTVGI